MSKVSYWFYLEPFVHVSIKSDKNVIIYNTLNGKIIEYSNEPEISQLVRKVTSNRNMYVIGIRKKDLENKKISSFIHDVRKNFMGDLLERTQSDKKPFQMMPVLKLERDVEELRKQEWIVIKDDAKMNFFEVVLYTNDRCERNCSICQSMFKQHTFCNKSTGQNAELNIDTIETLLTGYSGAAMGSCTITGGNVFLYSQFERLANCLNRLEIDKKFCVHYLNVDTHSESRLTMLRKDKFVLDVVLDLPVKHQELSQAMSILKKSGFDYNFQIIIQSEDDLEIVNHLVDEHAIQNVSLHPHFNGRNLDFFKNAVFVDKNDLMEAGPSQEQIFSRMHINPNYFGKLTVRSNGDIHANLNLEPIGNFYEDSITDVIYNEIIGGESWRATRGKAAPCKSCVYELLCPSISNYEYALKRNNLCHIY